MGPRSGGRSGISWRRPMAKLSQSTKSATGPELGEWRRCERSVATGGAFPFGWAPEMAWRLGRIVAGHGCMLHAQIGVGEARTWSRSATGTEASAAALLAIRTVGGTRSTGSAPGGLRGASGPGPSLKVFSRAGLPPCPPRKPAMRGAVAGLCLMAPARRHGRACGSPPRRVRMGTGRAHAHPVMTGARITVHPGT